MRLLVFCSYLCTQIKLKQDQCAKSEFLGKKKFEQLFHIEKYTKSIQKIVHH
jgi:hypothetical protein